MSQKHMDSVSIARAALTITLTPTREAEKEQKAKYLQEGIRSLAVDYGGEFLTSVQKVVERAIVAAKREGIISETLHEEGAIAGATKEALSQIMPKALGSNVGGKVGIARRQEHVVVAIFFAIGLLHLNEVGVGMGHRVI